MAFSNSHEINKLTIDIYPQFTRNVYWDVDSRRKYCSDDYRVEAHEKFFNWRREDEESMQRMLAWATKRIFAQSERVQKETDKYYWVNNKPIILSGITSRQRILFLRDITDRLRNECYSSMAFVIHFKLGNIEFSLELNPTKINQETEYSGWEKTVIPIGLSKMNLNASDCCTQEILIELLETLV